MRRACKTVLAAWLLLPAAILLFGIPVQAAAQDAPRVGRDGYREGMPAVLSPPRPPPESPFAAAYRRAGYPRLVLFFNRDITDIVAAPVTISRQDVLTGEVSTRLTLREPPAVEAARPASPAPAGPAQGEAGPGSLAVPALPALPGDRGAPRLTEGESVVREQVERRSEIAVQRQASGPRAAPMDEGSQWQFEAAFTRRLATGRVRIVDRAASVRLANGARTGADPQQLEVAAMRAHADLAVVVRAAPMASANGGNLFRVTAIDVRRGSIVADEVVMPPQSVAISMVPSATGDLAAAVLMDRFVEVWGPR